MGTKSDRYSFYKEKLKGLPMQKELLKKQGKWGKEKTDGLSFKDGDRTCASLFVLDARNNYFRGAPLNKILQEFERRSGKTSARACHDAVIVKREEYIALMLGRNQSPTRDTVLALCIAFELNVADTTALMNYCGFDFPTNRREGLVRLFIEFDGYGDKKTDGDVYETGRILYALDELLAEFNQKTFVG